MPLYFKINGQKPNGFLPKTSFGLAADRLSCALPRVPHLGQKRRISLEGSSSTQPSLWASPPGRKRGLPTSRDGQTSPHRSRLVVSHSTCPPLSPSPHANSFVIGTHPARRTRVKTDLSLSLSLSLCIYTLFIGGTRGIAIIEIAVNGSCRRLVSACNALERALLLVEGLSIRSPVGAI
jgi:hypothetical protein